MGWGEAVPVDTHVVEIARRDYKIGKGRHSSLTKATYDAIGDKFRSLWGKEAGWAHSVLFTADLRAFSERLKVEKVEKVEDEAKVEDVGIKQEEVDGATPEELMIKQVKIEEQEKETKKRIKREEEDDGVKNIMQVDGFVRSSKRARK